MNLNCTQKQSLQTEFPTFANLLALISHEKRDAKETRTNAT